MALEHLHCSVHASGEKDYGFGPYVKIDQENDTLTVKFQKGPIREVGVNGAQLDELFEIGQAVLKSLNGKFPCRENALAITKIEEALMWLEKRKKDRVERGVEGFNKE